MQTSVGSQGRTLLMIAIINKRDHLIDLLLKNGADANIQDRNGFSALHFTAQNFRIEAAEILLKGGAKVNPTDNFGATPLGRATSGSAGRGELIKLFLKYGADPSIKNKSGISAIDIANTTANFDLKQFFKECK
jgi:uncharacterized protein